MRCAEGLIKIQIPLPTVTMTHPWRGQYVFDDMYAVIIFYLGNRDYHGFFVFQSSGQHPHSYNSYNGGRLCIGNYESKFASLLKSGDYVSLYAKLCACANTYTPHDVVRESWNEIGKVSCDGCGDFWDKDDLEEIDGDLLCEYCRVFCHGYGCINIVARSDHNLCNECDEYFCYRHQRCCPNCEATLCDNCECSSCQGDENE